MRQRVLILAFLLCLICTYGYAVPKSNYNTEICTELVNRANSSFHRGKYSDAKVLYEQALATGDGYYAEFCRTRLQATNAMLAGSKKRAKTTSVFEISQDTVKISYVGGDYPIHVDGSNWSASTPADEDWCRIDVDKKKGIVKIYSSPNQSTSSRSTFVTIKNGNGRKKTVEVINEGSPEILRSSAQNLVFTPDGETNVVDIDANTDWNIADVPNWLRAIKGAGDIQFTASPNEENKDRIAQVKVETPSKQEITINIIQGATLDSLAFSKNNLHFGPDGGDEYIHVLTNANDWRFGDFPHWCQLERIDDNTIKVHCTPNEPVDMPREASVNVTTGTQHLGINVFQAPKPIMHIIPTDGIGGLKISFGFSAGYVYPMISSNSSSGYTFSPVNYAQGNEKEQVNYTSSGGVSIAAYTDIRVYKNLYLNAGINFLYYKYKNHLDGFLSITRPMTNQFYLKGEMLSSYKEEYSMMELDIPVLVSYRVPINKKSHLQINAGPVLCFGLQSELDFSGKSNSENMKAYKIINGTMTSQPYNNNNYASHLNYSGNLNMYSDDVMLKWYTSDGANGGNEDPYKFASAPYNRINFGLRFGLGYEFMGISLNVSYQYMVTNMANRRFWDSDRWTIFNNSTQLMTGYSQRNNLLMVTLGYTFRY